MTLTCCIEWNCWHEKLLKRLDTILMDSKLASMRNRPCTDCICTWYQAIFIRHGWNRWNRGTLSTHRFSFRLKVRSLTKAVLAIMSMFFNYYLFLVDVINQLKENGRVRELRDHIVRHFLFTPLKCNSCEKRVRDIPQLKEHLARHDLALRRRLF